MFRYSHTVPSLGNNDINLECKYPCHEQCKPEVPGNCSHDPKLQEYHAEPATEKVKKVGTAVKNRGRSLSWVGDKAKHKITQKDKRKKQAAPGKVN